MNLNSDQLHSLFRRNFYSFLLRSFVELNPATEIAENWHIEVMAQELERCRRGEIKRLIVNLPPRSLKSHCASVALPAWIMGHNPSAQITTPTNVPEPSSMLLLGTGIFAVVGVSRKRKHHQG